jgi:hypothetical protein
MLFSFNKFVWELGRPSQPHFGRMANLIQIKLRKIIMPTTLNFQSVSNCVYYDLFFSRLMLHTSLSSHPCFIRLM